MKYVPCVCASVCKHVQINDSEKSGLKNAQNEYAKCEGEAGIGSGWSCGSVLPVGKVHLQLFLIIIALVWPIVVHSS